MPPLRASPATPTPEQPPPTAYRPENSSLPYTSLHRAPPPTSAYGVAGCPSDRAAGEASTCTARCSDISSVMPPGERAQPAGLCPPLRTAIGSWKRRAIRSTAARSPMVAGVTTANGARSTCRLRLKIVALVPNCASLVQATSPGGVTAA
eukprot:scaffold26970_cov104-Isochrysis_galbana.AAC.2